jgi:hypothetical protein
MQLWQLKNTKTGEELTEASSLPENWGPICGMQGMVDKIDNLSWIGDEYADMGWVQVGEADDITETTEAEKAWNKAKILLQESDWTMLPDVPMTAGDKVDWTDYRSSLRNIRLQPDFPNTIAWPISPE